MSEFWLRKMRTYVHVFDLDKDGFISEDDFAELARVFSDKQNADDEKREKLIQTFRNVWRHFMKSADLEKESRVTAEIFAASVKKQAYDPTFINEFSALIRGLFNLLDVNQDGFLQPEEHSKLFDNMGVPEDRFDRKVGFDALDDDGNGVISIEELISGFFDFLFSNDETSSKKYFFGPLVD